MITDAINRQLNNKQLRDNLTTYEIHQNTLRMKLNIA